MIKIAEVVQELVRRSPFLSEALEEGLINISALARRFRPEVEKKLGKPIKNGAIVMAVNRMATGALTYEQRPLRDFFRKVSDISVRTSLVDFTFRNSDQLPLRQARLLQIIGGRPDVFYSVSRGISETTIVLTEALEGELEVLFHDEVLIAREVDLSAITLTLPVENRALYGVYYFILKDLAWEGVNLIEVISTSNEFTVIVRNEDLDRAFSVISKLRR